MRPTWSRTCPGGTPSRPAKCRWKPIATLHRPTGGGIGQAPGFAEAVTRELRQLAPVMPEVRVSALGTHAVVDGCLAAGLELAWRQLTATLPVAGGPHAPDGLSHDGADLGDSGPARFQAANA